MLRKLVVITSLLFATAAYAEGDVANGEKEFKKCASCHSIEEGGKNGAGPNLWNLSNRGVAAVPEYKYSAGLVEYAAANPMWTDAMLDAWLTNPKDVVKGTKMAMKVTDAQKRADVIAYLNSMGVQ